MLAEVKVISMRALVMGVDTCGGVGVEIFYAKNSTISNFVSHSSVIK